MFKGKLGNQKLGYIMLIPASLIILLVSIYPLINAFRLSMMSYNLFRPGTHKFVFLGNIIDVITNNHEFYNVLTYSFVYTFFVVLISYLLGLAFSLLLNKDIKFKGIFRALILVPWVVPPAVAATNWMWVLNDQIGIINIFLQNIGLIDSPILFLGSKEIARYTVIFTGAWKSFPFMTVVLLAGLTSIPKELYESARIDGAGPFKAFLHITMPMIKNVSLISTTLMFIWTFNNFENIYLLTQGGPAKATFVLSILSYYTAFFRGKLGYSAAIAVVMFFVLLIFSIFYLRFQRSAEDY